jgi:hypothetical protein
MDFKARASRKETPIRSVSLALLQAFRRGRFPRLVRMETNLHESLPRVSPIFVTFLSQLHTFALQTPESPKKAATAIPLFLPLYLAACVIFAETGRDFGVFSAAEASNEGDFK